MKEVRERVVNSKEEQKELMETEDVKVLGDLSDQVSHASECAKQGAPQLDLHFIRAIVGGGGGVSRAEVLS